METRWVGKPVARGDAVDKVTGRARYTSDVTLPHMAHAAIVRSPVGHGVIREVDASEALRLDGVLAVLTADDLAGVGVVDSHFGLTVLDQAILAEGRVRFTGDPVAAVVAETEAAAQAAVGLVQVDVEPLPAAYTTEDALGGVTIVHPERDSADPDLPNVATRVAFSGGDVDAALAQAHFVHEATYRFPMMSHYPMEPHCCVARWEQTDLEIVTGTQQPFKVRSDLARMFALRMNQVRVRTGYIGGAYGGKLLTKYEPLTAALARATGRPVRLAISSEESFKTVARHGAIIHMRTGIDEQGNLVARDTVVHLDTGAYADKGPGVAKKAAYRAKGPYDIPHFRSVALAVYTNKVPAGAFRGYSTPQVAWAGESAINEIADHLGIDPLAYRERHLLPRGGSFMPKDTPLDADLAQGVRKAADLIGWGTPLAPGHGRGVATGVKDGGGGPSRAEAEVRLLADGSVEVLTGTTEIGQGSMTVFAQIAAEEIGCDLERVHARLPDTASSPFDHGTEASRSTVLVGSAVRNAARDVRASLQAIVDRVLGEPTTFTLDGAAIRCGERTLTIAELLSRDRNLPLTTEFELGPVVGVGYHNTFVGSEAPLGTPSNFYEVGHGAAEVRVDGDTGEVHLLRYGTVADVGRAMNPTTCTAQDEGSVIMAIGHTMFEELVFEEDQPLNTNLAEYRVPGFSNLPEGGIDAYLLENGDGPGPYGAKGAGEGGIIAVSPAVAHAVYRACGVRLRELPLTPERVWRALNDTSGEE